MKRRTFLGAATLGAAAVSLPAFVDRAFAQRLDPDESAAAVANAFRRGALVGRPVLVVVVPDDTQKYERGKLWGELLNHGSDELLWPLALVEVVAAPYSAARRIVPALPSDEPLAVVIETDGSRRTTAVNADVPSIGWQAEPEGLGWDERDAWADDRIDTRMERLARALRRGIAGDAGALAARAYQARERMDASDRGRLDALVGSRARVPAELVRAGAAIVALATKRDAAARGPLRARLSAVVREDLVEQPIPGTHWATSAGCGSHIEGLDDDQQLMMACGMGHVPERSQRFVHFFAVRRRR